MKSKCKNAAKGKQIVELRFCFAWTVKTIGSPETVISEGKYFLYFFTEKPKWLRFFKA